MMPNPTDLPHNAAYAIATAALLGVVVGALAVHLPSRRRRGRPAAPAKKTKLSRGDLLAAGIATAVSAEGMWETFSSLGMPIPLRIATFAFIELAMVQAARRAKRSMDERFRPGVDGIAMWVLTCLSAVLSAAHEITTEDPNSAVVLVRLIAPLVAAWGWERNMALERRRLGLTTGIHWRITPERILVRLGLAEPTDRTAGDVDAHRRITRVARAAKRVRTMRATGTWAWRIQRATSKLDKLMEHAVEHAALATDPARQKALLAQLGALYNAEGLAELDAEPPWATAARAELLPDVDHELTDEQLVALGADAARAQDWLTDRYGLDLPAHEVARALAETSRTVPGLHIVPNPYGPYGPQSAVRTATSPYGAYRPRTDRDGHDRTTSQSSPYGDERTGPHATPPDGRADAARTNGKSDARTDRTAQVTALTEPVRRSREEWVTDLAEEIRTAEATGHTWSPDYDDLTARTGYGKSWCEKTVRAARTEAARTGRTEGAVS